MEVWKDIKGYEGYYQVSDKGNVRSLEREIILKDRLGNDRPSIYKGRVLKPYQHTFKRSNIKPRLEVVLSKGCKYKTFYVHLLVAKTFVANPYNHKTINHIDGDALNNTTENLEWVSLAENTHHAFKNGLIKTQKPVAQIDANTGKVVKTFTGESEACRHINVSQGKIGRAIQRNGTCKGFKWEYVNIEGVTTIESWKGFSE